MSGATPYSLAMLLCDQVIVDERSKKKTLVGLFDIIYAKSFPAKHPSLSVYARLTDAEGQYKFRMDYVQVKTDNLLGRADIPPIDITDRLKTHELVMQFPPIDIPVQGEYEFRLWANDRYVGRVKFTALKLEEN
jgi:hypothetical protein